MVSLDKPKRIKDGTVLQKYRKGRCEICGLMPSDPCHLKTVGSGGPDADYNVVSLCRNHHIEQHALGLFKMCEKYPFFRQVIANKGWVFDGQKKLRRA
jgi:hypothetical protein